MFQKLCAIHLAILQQPITLQVYVRVAVGDVVPQCLMTIVIYAETSDVFAKSWCDVITKRWPDYMTLF